MADYPYTGRRGAEIGPDSDYELIDYNEYAGEIGVGLTPAATVCKSFVYVGRRAAALLTDENSPEFSKEYSGSIDHTWIPDFVELEAEFVYAGSIGMALTPAASYGAARNYTGSLTVALTPESVSSGDVVYTGAVTIALAPDSDEPVLDKIITGSITVQVRLVSEYEGTGVTIREYEGSIPVLLLPIVESAIVEAVYSGELGVTLAPHSTYEPLTLGEYSYYGSLPIALTPGSFYVRVGPDGVRPLYAHPRPRKRIIDVHRRRV